MYTKDSGRRVVPLPSCGGRQARKLTKDANVPAIRTRVAAFSGSGFVAEREGDELVVYLVTTQPVPTAATGDALARFNNAMAAKIANVQKRNEAARGH